MKSMDMQRALFLVRYVFENTGIMLYPDIILRKGPVSVEISNSVSAELLSRIGDIFHAE